MRGAGSWSPRREHTPPKSPAPPPNPTAAAATQPTPLPAAAGFRVRRGGGTALMREDSLTIPKLSGTGQLRPFDLRSPPTLARATGCATHCSPTPHPTPPLPPPSASPRHPKHRRVTVEALAVAAAAAAGGRPKEAETPGGGGWRPRGGGCGAGGRRDGTGGAPSEEAGERASESTMVVATRRAWKWRRRRCQVRQRARS
ncbi:unnamed protein product [Lampetra planeri]